MGSGTDTFTYIICDGFGGTSTSTVYITVGDDDDGDVGNNNSAPTAGDDSYETPKDTTLIISLPGVLTNDKDEDGDALVVTSASNPSRGSRVMDPNGSFVYVPEAGFTGTVTFTYMVSDQNGGSDEATVTIDIVDVNRAPKP